MTLKVNNIALRQSGKEKDKQRGQAMENTKSKNKNISIIYILPFSSIIYKTIQNK